MERSDVSFTFLDRIREVEENTEDGRFQSALALALTLPDICGGIAFPEMVKRHRDGRIMRDKSGEPSRDTGRQYIQWTDTYGAEFLKKAPEDRQPYICGERLWQLRCGYLHQNRGFDNETPDMEVQFHLGLNCGSSVCDLDVETESGIRLDIEELCRRLCLAARSFYEERKGTLDFTLYNTPVIDFMKRKEETFSGKRVLGIVTRDKVYGTGLRMALGQHYRLAVAGSSWGEVRKKLKKEKPDVWIMDREFLKFVDSEDGPAVFLLRGYGDGNAGLEECYPYIDKNADLKEIRRKIRSEQGWREETCGQ